MEESVEKVLKGWNNTRANPSAGACPTTTIYVHTQPLIWFSKEYAKIIFCYG